MKPNICLVEATYYPDILSKLHKGAVNELKGKYVTPMKRKNFLQAQFFVPGIFEIPVVISRNIDSYDGFIALGCIIKGKTPHFELISKAVTNAIMNLSITYKKPIGNGILTCDNKKQAVNRADPNKKDKGGDAANAAISVFNIIK